MGNKSKLVEMEETETGYCLNNLTPFFLQDHIDELLDNAKVGLTIYTEYQRIASNDNTEVIIGIIREACDLAKAKSQLMAQFSISEYTAQSILDMRLEEVCNFGSFDYQTNVEIYKEAVSSLTKMAQMKAEHESLN